MATDNSPPKKVLLISSNSSSRGGGERYLVFMTLGLKKLGVEVHVLLSKLEYMDAWELELKDAGAVVHRSELKGLVHRPLRFVQSILARSQHANIARVCNDVKPDAILVNQQYDEDGIDYIMGALQADVCPVAGVIHMPMTAGKNSRPLGRLRGAILNRWYGKHRYRIIFSSTGGAKEFTDYYGSQHHTCTVVSGVPLKTNSTKLADSVPSQITAPNNFPLKNKGSLRLPTIGVACQFVPQKNLNLLIDGWLVAAQTGQQSRLLLIGDGPQRSEVEERLAEVDSSLWQITGWTDKYAEYLAQLDLFVMTSDYEGLPLTLIEVAGMGIPTLVVDFNGAKEVADQAPWVHVLSDRSPEALAIAMTNRINGFATEEAASTEDKGKFIEYFSPQRMATDFLAIFNDSCGIEDNDLTTSLSE